MTHGYDHSHPDAPPHPFQPVCRWTPIHWRSTGDERYLRHDGKLWRWLHNVSESDMARPEVQADIGGRPYIFSDPRPTHQRGGHILVEMGVLGLCVQVPMQTLERHLNGHLWNDDAEVCD